MISEVSIKTLSPDKKNRKCEIFEHFEHYFKDYVPEVVHVLSTLDKIVMI